MTQNIFAYSRSGLPIFSYNYGAAGPLVLILGGVHGDEIEGVAACMGLQSLWQKNYDFRLQICLVPTFNIDGVLAKTRGNLNGVDLNRNLPSLDWSPNIATPRYHPGPSAMSEPENQGLVSFLKDKQPVFILSLHSYHPMLCINGDCILQAQAISKLTGYRIDESMGYPTPGSLGSYSGLEGRAPVLTYEIERGLDSASILKIHVPAICEALKTLEP